MTFVPGQGKWPIEPTTLYVFSYYPTNGINEAPSYNSNLLEDYNATLTAATAYLLEQNNIGVCIITPITCTIVRPYIPFQAF